MLQYSPKITTDGLVMCLDASNNKSYPTDLPVKNGLALWLDAADDTTFSYSSGTSVSQWRDKSGNNRHFFQATVNNQPSRSAVINSRKAIQFTAVSGQYLRYNSTIINNTTGGSVFVVWRTAGETNAYSSILDNYHCGNSALNAGFQIERNVANNQYYWGFVTTGCANAGFMPATSYSNDTTNCIWITKDSTTITGGLNGTSGTPNASPSATWVEDTKGWTIGAWGLGIESFDRFFNGQQCEVIIFNRGLSVTERKQVNTYLGQKWGISNTDRSIVDLSGNEINPEMSNTIFSPDNRGVINFNGKAIGTNAVSVIKTTTSIINRNDGQEITVSCWIKPLRTSGQYSIIATNRSNDDTIYNWIFYQHTDNGAISFHGDAQNKSTYIPTINQWINAVNTVTAAGVSTLYINGVSVFVASGYTYGNGTPSRLGIGANPSSAESFQGSIAQTLIYNRALSAVEVLQNYEALKSKFANTIVESGLVLNLDAGNIYSYGGAGTTFYDVSPTALSWTINNATYNSDPIKYFSYNGSSSWLQSSTSTAYDSQTITMECWCYPNTLSQEGFLFEKGQVNTQYSMFFESINATSFVFRTMGTVSNYNLTFNVNTYLTVSAWNHIVCTYNGSSKIAYVNGVQVASVAASGTLPTGQVNQYIGRHSGGYFFNGRIGESRVYNIALSAAQVLQNYNATKGRFGL
jgi:hypothetical protein